MESCSSSPHSQQPSICPYLQPATSPPYPFLNINFNIIFPSTLRPWKCFFSQVSSSKPWTQLTSHPSCYMSHQSRHSWFDHSNNVWSGWQIMKLLIMQSFLLPCYHIPLRPKYLPQRHILRNRQPMGLAQVPHPYKQKIITVMHIVIIIFYRN